MKNTIFLLIVLIFYGSCTENPFFEDDSTQDKKVLRGKVLLDSGETPDDIYVWLEQLNISTRTNSLGDFRIELPRADELSGYNNDLKLYYYVGNYQISHSNLLIVDGQFEFNKFDINSDGKIKDIIYLRKLIDISTNFRPDTVHTDVTTPVHIEAEVINIDSNLLVINRVSRDGILSGFIFREINSPRTSAKTLDFPGTNYRGYYLSNTMVWEVDFNWDPGFLSPGTYEVSTYFFLRQEEIPQELLDSFGEDADNFNEAYLKIPFTQTAATMIVQ